MGACIGILILVHSGSTIPHHLNKGRVTCCQVVWWPLPPAGQWLAGCKAAREWADSSWAWGSSRRGWSSCSPGWGTHCRCRLWFRCQIPWKSPLRFDLGKIESVHNRIISVVFGNLACAHTRGDEIKCPEYGPLIDYQTLKFCLADRLKKLWEITLIFETLKIKITKCRKISFYSDCFSYLTSECRRSRLSVETEKWDHLSAVLRYSITFGFSLFWFSKAEFRINDILVRIRIRILGSVPFTNGSGSGFGSARLLLISAVTFKTPAKNIFSSSKFYLLCIFLFDCTFTSFFKDKLS